MINLREKLNMVKEKGKSNPSPPIQRTLFIRTQSVPRDSIEGIDAITAAEIHSCEPTFEETDISPESMLFLDTETTGLAKGAGTLAFEVGVGYFESDQFVIKQMAIREYANEAEMLKIILKQLEEHPVIVTFNGKSFDLPLLESRCVMNGMRVRFEDYAQLDLLHIMRRVYKLRLQHCTLGALEEAVLGTHRTDDLPGAMVPQRFFDYMRTRNFDLIEDVLRHNYDDVLSMPKLLADVCGAFRTPETLAHPEDIYGVGRTFVRSGQIEKAKKCYRTIGHTTMSGQARLRLTELNKKEKNWQETIDLCHTMIADHQNGSAPYIELAKYYEHVEKNYEAAERICIQCLRYLTNYLPLYDREEDQEELAMLYKRLERIRGKKERQRT